MGCSNGSLKPIRKMMGGGAEGILATQRIELLQGTGLDRKCR